VFADDFVAGLADGGEYSEEELACLGEAYGALSEEQVGAIVVAGLNPTDPPPQAREAVEAVFGACGLDIPE
jgi:hypothetical protein